MIPRLSRVVDKQQSADSEPGLARRFGFMSAVTFTLSMLALDVTETVAVVRKIDNDPLSVGVSILIPLAFVAMLAAIQLDRCVEAAVDSKSAGRRQTGT